MSQASDNTQVTMDDLKKGYEELQKSVKKFAGAQVDPPPPPPEPVQTDPNHANDLQRSINGAPFDVSQFLSQFIQTSSQSNEYLVRSINDNIKQTTDLGEGLVKALQGMANVQQERFEAVVEGMGGLLKGIEVLSEQVQSLASTPVTQPQALVQQAQVQAPAPMQHPQDLYRSQQAPSPAPQVNHTLGGIQTPAVEQKGWDPNSATMTRDEMLRRSIAAGEGYDLQGAGYQQQAPAPQPQHQSPPAQPQLPHPNGNNGNVQYDLGQVAKALESLVLQPNSGVTHDDVISFNVSTSRGNPVLSQNAQAAVTQFLGGSVQ